jgi:hypothetical protein
MLSQKQIDANRENALKSTGPRTEAGKKRSAQNALRHGLTGQVTIMSDDDRIAHDLFIDEYMAVLAPDNAVERQLAQSIAEDNWRLNRARAIEDNLFALGHNDEGSNHPEIEVALSGARTYLDHSHEIQLLTLYEQRIHRNIRGCENRLKELQTERKAARARALLDAERIAQVAATKAHRPRSVALNNSGTLPQPPRGASPLCASSLQGETPEPITLNGFVFSTTEIRDSLAQRRLIDAAWNHQFNKRPPSKPLREAA